MKLGKRLIMLQTEKELTSVEVGNSIGVKPCTYKSWRQGKYAPKTDSLIRLANLFGVTIDYLVGRSDIRVPIEYSSGTIDSDLEYCKRTWLNPKGSPSTGSVVTFHGAADYGRGETWETFVEIADCLGKVRLQKIESDTYKQFAAKAYLLSQELVSFANWILETCED